MDENNKREVAAGGRRHSDRTANARRGAGESSLKRRWPLVALAAAAIISAAASLSPNAVGEAKAQRLLAINAVKRTASITVAVGKTEDVRIDAPFTEITVGDAEVADVAPLTDHTLSILGKKIGTTRVSIYGEGKRSVGISRIMLTGNSLDAPTLDKAVVIARQFAPDVINAVQVLQPQQVMLEVRFIEAKRQAGRELGVQWNSFGKNTLTNVGARTASDQLPVTTPGGPFQQPAFNPPGAQLGGKNILSTQLPISPIVAAGVLSGAVPFGFLLGSMNRGGLSIDVAINALEEKGLARSLAEPNLVALSGDTASFLAGGEFPVPVPGSLGTVTIDYKRYGVGLAFTPTVLRDGLINLKIEPEVSELDLSHPVVVAGISVPPLIVRRAATTVELRDGQSFVIGGLLQNVSTTAQQQLPWLGDVPVLGALFRSAEYRKSESDLAIIVTPRIVRPTRPGDPVKTPLDNTLPANDIDFFLMGKAEITPADARLAVGHQRPFVGHILDLRKEGANVVQVKN